MNALHPDYRRGDPDWNRRHQTYPVVAYVQSAPELLRFVQEYAGERMICYGINPRPSAFANQYDRARSAREADLRVSQSLVLDIDLEGVVSPSRLASLTRFLSVADAYFLGLGLRRPVRASSGTRGSHLLFAYPPITVADCHDLHHRLRSFRAAFVNAVRQDLARLEARVDTGTLALRAAVKVYGTGKPGGALSRFYGKERVEDTALRDYLRSLPAPQPVVGTVAEEITPSSAIPDWFTHLVATDGVIRNLWEGTGKRSGDTTGSGYDFSLTRTLLDRGYTKAGDLASILLNRPTGPARTKGLSYVARTITRAKARDQL